MKATELGITGWCRNTDHGTVEGHAQGPREAGAALRRWLAHDGSPHSRVDRAVFSNAREIETVPETLTAATAAAEGSTTAGAAAAAGKGAASAWPHGGGGGDDGFQVRH
ncbi:unnamed protein product [Phaeothamnion confervicola]